MPASGAPPYRSALDYLFARTTGSVKLGLERVHALLEELGDPHWQLPCIHVAGTNGKGSTVALTAAILRSRGHRVAVYTSPHLVDFRERIVVDDDRISEDEVTAFIEQRIPSIERLGATFFEATTAMAFDYFARSSATVAVIETGLGGRLDATNVVDPLVAGVTGIGRDHTEYLGETLEEIALEKAGIFKRDRAAVIGEGDPALRKVLVDAARERGSSPIRTRSEALDLTDVRVSAEGTTFTAVERGTTVEGTHVRVPLIGAHQAANCAMAWLLTDAAGPAYRIPLADLSSAVAPVRLPGRFDRRGKYVFDVAHNRAGSEVLAETLGLVDLPRPIVAVFSALRDKEWRPMIQALSGAVDEFILTDMVSAPPGRGWDIGEAKTFIGAEGIRARIIRDFDQALRVADETGASVVVTGSFHTVGDAMIRLQSFS